MRAFNSITENLPRAILEQLDKNRSIATLRKGNRFRIRKKHIVAISDQIFPNQDVKDEKVDLIEQIGHNLVDEGSSVVGWGQRLTIFWKWNFVSDLKVHYLRTLRMEAKLIIYGTFFEVDCWEDRALHQHDLLIFIRSGQNCPITHLSSNIELILRQLHNNTKPYHLNFPHDMSLILTVFIFRGCTKSRYGTLNHTTNCRIAVGLLEPVLRWELTLRFLSGWLIGRRLSWGVKINL